MITFTVEHKAQKARGATLKIGDTQIATPAFIPESTGLDVKAVFADKIPSPILYADIYRPMLRPGLDILKEVGLKDFIGFKGLLFAGGGASELAKLSAAEGTCYKSREEALDYASYIDGSRKKLSPEISIRMQKKMGADIFSGLYDFPSGDSLTRKKIGAAARRSDRWTKRAWDIFKSELSGKAGANKAFFAPISGGAMSDIRTQSARFCIGLDTDGFLQTPAFKNEPRKAYMMTLASTTQLLPADKPCAVLGLKNEDEVIEAVRFGADIIIADFPIVDGMRGIIYQGGKKLNIKDEKFADDKTPFAKDYTLAYLHHLFSAGEILGLTLAVENNLAHMDKLMSDIRFRIEKGTLS